MNKLPNIVLIHKDHYYHFLFPYINIIWNKDKTRGTFLQYYTTPFTLEQLSAWSHTNKYTLIIDNYKS